MNTTQILSKRISLCPEIHARSYKATTLFEALNSIRVGKYKSQIENIRRLHSLGPSAIAGYKSKKKRLTSFIFSGSLFDTRCKFDVYGYTSLLVVDIDKLESVHSIKASLKNDPYVVAVWLSPSGNGLKALFYLQYENKYDVKDTWIYHEHCAFPQVEEYLRSTYGIHIDQTGRDITRLCFVSYDPDIHLKKVFEPFLVSCALSGNDIRRIRGSYYSRKKVKQILKEQMRISKILNKASDKDNDPT